MNKAEIEKILEELIGRGWFGKTKDNKFFDNPIQVNESINQATSSITALIIKWLEKHKVNYEEYGGAQRNHLITELIGEVR